MQNASALNTLTTGRHKITVIFETGYADCEFTVTEKSKPTDPVKPAESDEPAKPENPKTGEDFCVGFVSLLFWLYRRWVCLCQKSLCVIAGKTVFDRLF